MTRTVICGVDHSPRSSSVVEAAATLADALDAELLLAHSRKAPSIPPGRAAPHPDFAGWQPPKPDTETSAADLHSELLPYGRPGATRTVVLTGDPGRALCDLAAETRAGLVVVGSRGRGAVRTFLLGSVSTEVVQHAPCPVMVVPDTALAGLERPVVDGSTVVCGVGFREDRRLVSLAAALAAGLGLRLRVAHVRPTGSNVAVIAAAGAVPPTIVEPDHASAMPEIAGDLQLSVDRAVEARPQLAGAVDWLLCTDVASAGLHKLAVSARAAVVVVGTDSERGRSGGPRTSPAWMLAREGSLPVVIARRGVRWQL